MIVAALAIGVTGVAIAADQLISTQRRRAEHARGHARARRHRAHLHGRLEDVEFHCVLAKAPAAEVTDSHGNPAWKGTVEPSVDASKHVNGGCRSLASDGREWQCYIGQAAVDQKIIGQSLLGEFAPAPGVG